ncbi:MAG: excalibur calcium-binding domain-containing protein [Sphingopyxis sp.]|jgi:peptidoglycan/LPS O-acetylase OafA/YrhL|uniref:excalibur calcium-binding domain-containing protein n=1 Tax=Alphaproteobacteria TaxID=28211 RepID=UPI00403383A2
MARHWKHRRRGRRPKNSAVNFFVGAGLIGAVVGVGSTATTPEGRTQLASAASDIAVAAGMARARTPEDGDYWRRCDDARAAGSAPLYRGEPGYRDGLDADDDGIACEPYRGQ